MVFRGWILQGVLAYSLVLSSFGGSLGDRNKAVSERNEKKKEAENNKNSGSYKSEAHSSFGSGTYPSSNSSSSGFLSDMVGWLIMAPFAYRHDDPSSSLISENEDGWAEEGSSFFPKHTNGQATVPYLRADFNMQSAENVDADDIRLEGGYKFVGAQARFTRYTDEADEELNIRQYYLMLRYGGYRPSFFRGSFEAAVGIGIAHHSGTSLSNYGLEDDSSGALTFSLKYYPYDWVGVEFRPTWWRFYDIVHGDYDLSVSAGYRYLQVRGGYRWIWENGYGIIEELSGPYAGVSLSF